MKSNIDRRHFLRLGGGTAGALLLSSTGAVSRAMAQACGLTPAQVEGPFYPGEAEMTAENDLTRVAGSSARALGQVAYIRGKVLDAACRPIAGANVEIWQACASGRYNSAGDPNPAPLDPNFRYWGETFTDAQGEYSFKTIVPGAYPADVDWWRPPHIHFKVSRLGYRELITQMYFAGEALNGNDLILGRISAGERNLVIVDFAPAPEGYEPGSLLGSFDITLRSVRRPS